MFNFSKNQLFHNLLNRKYNLFYRIVISFLGSLITFILLFNFRISNFIFKRIFFGNDLKNELRRIFWFLKISYLCPYLTIDLMYDFSYDLDKEMIIFLKRKLLHLIKVKENIYVKFDLLRLMAYEINNFYNDSNIKPTLIHEFRNSYFELETLLKKSKKLQLPVRKFRSKNNNKNSFKNAKDTFYDLKGFLDYFNIDWFPISGTLLGFIRESSFLKHDLDIDIGIMETDFSINKFKKFVEQSSIFSISRIEYQKIFLNNNQNYSKPIYLRLIHSSGLNIDIFLHYILENKIYHGTSSLLWENSLFKLKNYEVYDLKIKVPDNSDLYLTETYGHWRKENKNYNYHRDMLSLKGANNFLGLEYLLRSSFYFEKKSEKFLKDLEHLLF